jgi:hypothetical protein
VDLVASLSATYSPGTNSVSPMHDVHNDFFLSKEGKLLGPHSSNLMALLSALSISLLSGLIFLLQNC